MISYGFFSGIGTRLINSIYIKLQQCTVEECEQNYCVDGKIEVDESYFGLKRMRGKRDRGAGSKMIVV